ncbi:MAG: serine/threonine-protein kinase [Planctomycetota bacterium]
MTSECPDDERLRWLLDQSGSDPEVRALEEHVENCEKCQQRLSAPSPELRLDSSVSSTSGLSSRSPKRHSDRDQAFPLELEGFTFLEKLAVGGMGVVYRAIHHRLQREVAIKVLSETSRHRPDRWMRLRTEGIAVARMEHPHIIRVYDSGEQEGRSYVVQELADGGSLKERLSTGPMRSTEAAAMVADLGDALEHAHQQGVLHRDIKPANVLFRAGKAKLADFGLAKLLDAQEDLTQTKDVIGTPGYMSPEQAAGEPVDKRTDVFSLGVLLYETLTGTPPFQAPTPVETLRRIREHDPVHIQRLQPNVDRDLQTICLKCLEKRPDDRYDNAADLRDDIKRFLNHQPILARPASLTKRLFALRRRHPVKAAFASAMMAAAVVLLCVWAYFTRELSNQRTIARQNAVLANKSAIAARESEDEARDSLEKQLEANAASEEVLDFLASSMFEASNPGLQGYQVTVREVMESSARQIETEFKDRPRIEAPLRYAIGNTFYLLGDPTKAKPHLERAVSLFEQFSDVNEPRSAYNARHSFGKALMHTGELERAREILVSLRDSAWHEDSNVERDLKEFEAGLLYLERRFKECLKFLEQFESELRSEDPLATQAIINLLELRSMVYREQTDFEKFIPSCYAIYDFAKQHCSEDPVQMRTAVNAYAVGLTRDKKYAEAEQIYREELDLITSRYGSSSVTTVNTKQNLASNLWFQGRASEAIEWLSEVVEQQSKLLGPTNRVTLEALFSLGRMCESSDRHQQGVEYFELHLRPHLAERADTGQWTALVKLHIRLARGAKMKSLAERLSAIENEWLETSKAK